MKKTIGIVLTAALLMVCSIGAAELQISTDNLAIPGEWTEISITADGLENPIKSFSLSLAVLQSRYAIVNITPGADIDACDWEYFTYRFFRQDSIPEYDLGDARHLLTVTAMAGNSGCSPTGDDLELLNLRMLLDYETTRPFTPLACSFHPVRFYWRDCTDNVLFTAGGDRVFAVTDVVDPYDTEIAPTPGYTPPQGPCDAFDPVIYDQSLNAVNGGIDFVCSDTLYDGRGDLNVNGRPYEIADVILYNCVFLWGLTCFDIDLSWQLTQSDVNRDGYPVSVSDMVYMMRLMTHEIMPIERLNPVVPSATVSIMDIGSDQRLTVENDQPIAGLYVKLAQAESAQINVIPMDNDFIQVGRIGDTTTILIFDTETGEDVLSAGLNDLVDLPGQGWEVVGVEAVTSTGNPFNVLTSQVLPESPVVLNNYPNPFNPTTTIVFNLAKQTEWTVSIYDITGRAVRTLSGFGQGNIAVDWDGLDQDGAAASTGVYFYRLTANDKTAARKMLLLK
ncbi:MAG TPA: T9SS type A sorting domain-containing protein [candidate division Zixibacteria bacterium]|nr:T9SS type A sorting domain-containing protein [candidate division Zixibacteria bacterium]